MLENDFYILKQTTSTAENIQFDIELNANHEIYGGHFPGQPVTPGVCMLQIVKELAQKHTGHPLFLKECMQVKFMALINPLEQPSVSVFLEISDEEENVYKVKSFTTFESTMALKLICKFKKILQ